MTNPYEIVARQRKAAKLAEALRKYQIDANRAARMTAAQWDRLAAALGIKSPSETTQAMALRLLRGGQ